MVGGIFTSFVLELVVYPAIYEIWKWHFEMKRARAETQPASLLALPSPEKAAARAEAPCAGGGSLPLSDTLHVSPSTARLSIN
jgi:hypothetical protein